MRVESVQAREHQQLRAFLEVLQAHLFTEESCGAQAGKQPRNPRHATTYSVKAKLGNGLWQKLVSTLQTCVLSI